MLVELDQITVSIATAALYAAGWLSILHALRNTRTSQGTIAWCIALFSFPPVALPMYWIFGRTRFYGYREAIRDALEQHADWAERADKEVAPFVVGTESLPPSLRVYDSLTSNRFTRGNQLKLLIDGKDTFDEIFAAIDGAEDYLLVQFFIVKDDELGNLLKEKLIARANEGVRVYFLYDSIGSYGLSRRYLDALRDAGISVGAFRTGRGIINPFQINFRNHRKIVVADGRVAFVGGHNVGDEYLGRDLHFGHWRDTHVRIEGPAVQMIQRVFSGDWYWATHEFLYNVQLKPQPPSSMELAPVLPLPTGPVDDRAACALFFVNAIHRAKKRLWIASPYFVPDESIRTALSLAVLRGVDVRILIPDRPDHKVVYWAMFSFVHQMQLNGVQVYRYSGGFLHQKVLLADNSLAAVGTANLDNRSFRLNFELTIVANDVDFVNGVEEMLEADFEASTRAAHDELTSRSIVYQLLVQVARLFAPLL